MKALVTGATGFLGSHLCRRLVREGYEVAALSRPTSKTDLLDELPVDMRVGDITDPQTVDEAVAGNEVVFHAAAHLAYWSGQKDLQNEINIRGTENLVGACRRAGVKRLIHVSSVAAVGIPPDPAHPADENFRFNLGGSSLNYHISKKRAEEIVCEAAAKGLEAVVVNPSTIWGRFGNFFRGAEIAQKVRQSRIVPYYTGGICVVHVEDVVEGMMAALERGRPGERYILGGENLTIREISEIAAREQKVRRTFVPVPRPVSWLAAAILESAALVSRRRPRISYATHYGASRFHYYDSGKAKKELRYSPRDFVEIIRECISHIESSDGKQSGQISSRAANPRIKETKQ